jgi:hypothetical protein
MKKALALTFVTFAIAAVVAGMATTGSIQIVQADHKTGHEYGSGPGTPSGQPYGQLVAEEAQKESSTNEKGFGDDIQDFCDNGRCGNDDENLGNFRASDEAGKDGKAQDNRDESAGNPDN